MASKRTLKRAIHSICEDLFAEAIAVSLYGAKDQQSNAEALLFSILKVEDGGWLGAIGQDDKDRNRSKDSYADGKRLNADKTDRKLSDEQWEIVAHYPFIPKDPQKRTCSKALVMTHAYSNALMDKIEEAVKNGLVGNEDDDW